MPLVLPLFFLSTCYIRGQQKSKSNVAYLHVCDVSARVSGVIVLTLSRPIGQTYRLEFWYGGQVEEYHGQDHRSRSRGQKMFVRTSH